MYDERLRIKLTEDTYSYIGRNPNKKNAETFKTSLQKYINLIRELIDTDFNKLTDQEFYKLLSKVYYIALDMDDYLKMISMYNDKKYTSYYRIPTAMTFKDIETEGHGKDFDWWEQLYQVYYVVVVTKEFNFDYNKTYTKEEIKHLVATKEIALLTREQEPINHKRKNTQEEYEEIPTLDIDIKGYGDNITEFVINNYHLFGKLLRRKYTKKAILKDMKKMISNLNSEIEEIFSRTKSKDYNYSKTAKLCQEWFETSPEKEEYQAMQRRLK